MSSADEKGKVKRIETNADRKDGDSKQKPNAKIYRKHECLNCKAKFAKIKELKAHQIDCLRIEHKRRRVPLIKKEFETKISSGDEATGSQDEVSEASEKNSSGENESEKVKVNPKKRKGSFRCQICNASFTAKNSLEKHVAKKVCLRKEMGQKMEKSSTGSVEKKTMSKNLAEADVKFLLKSEIEAQNFDMTCPKCSAKFTNKIRFRNHISNKICSKRKKKAIAKVNLSPNDFKPEKMECTWRDNPFFQGNAYPCVHLRSISEWIAANLPDLKQPFEPMNLALKYDLDPTKEGEPCAQRSLTLGPFEGKVLPSLKSGEGESSPEIYMNACGTVWSLEVCPHASKCVYIAVGIDGPMQADRPRKCNVYGVPGTVLGVPSPSPNLVQIWKISLGNDSNGKAEMIYAIGQGGGRVFSAVWAPDKTPRGDTLKEEYLGLLSVACADGILRIFVCPSESVVPLSTDKQVMETKPMFVAHLEDSIITCSAWHPKDNRVILCGLTDGGCIIFQLPNEVAHASSNTQLDASISLQPWLRYCTNMLSSASNQGSHSMRAVSWCPSEPHFFASCGYNEQLCLWDSRDTNSGRSLMINSKARTGTAIAWDPFGNGIMFTQMDSPYFFFRPMTRSALPLWKALSMPQFAPQHAAWSLDVKLVDKYAVVVAATPDAEVALMAYSDRHFVKYSAKNSVSMKDVGYDQSRPSVIPVRLNFCPNGIQESSDKDVSNNKPVTVCHIGTKLVDSRALLPSRYFTRPALESLVHAVRLFQDHGKMWLLCGGATGLVKFRSINDEINEAMGYVL